MTTATAQKEKTASPLVHQGLMDILMKLAPFPAQSGRLDRRDGFGAGTVRSFRGHLAYRHGHHLRPRIQSRQRHSQSFGSGRQNNRQNNGAGKRKRLFFLVFERSQAKNGLEGSGRFAENQDSFDLIRPRRQ